MHDVIVVGGGVAGLSAALVLGRCLRDVLVVDSGRPRNAPSKALHGLLGHDGIAPQALREAGREDLLRYPSVRLREGQVRDCVPDTKGFEVTLADGDRVACRALLLATGVTDQLPP